MQYIILNNHIVETSDYIQRQGSTLSIYEVVRVEQGVVLFLDDHFERLKGSLAVSQKRSYTPTRQEWHDTLDKLISINSQTEGNIKFTIDFFLNGSSQKLFEFIPHHYPTNEDYLKGYHVELLNGERENPHVKTANQSVRTIANNQITNHKINEVLLVNHEGLITEGSRTNFFAIKNNQLITAPDSLVLGGIIRKKVLDIASKQNIKVIETCLHKDEIKLLDAAFITGTSPRVMPISLLENITLPSQHAIIQLVQSELTEMINNYINQHKANK